MPLLSHTGCFYALPQTTLESEHTPTLLGYLRQSKMGANTAQLVSLEKVGGLQQELRETPWEAGAARRFPCTEESQWFLAASSASAGASSQLRKFRPAHRRLRPQLGFIWLPSKLLYFRLH